MLGPKALFTFRPMDFGFTAHLFKALFKTGLDIEVRTWIFPIFWVLINRFANRTVFYFGFIWSRLEQKDIINSFH